MKQMTMKQTREALALLSIVDMMHVEGLAAGTVNENAASIEYKVQGGRPVRYIHISSRARKVNLDAIAAAVAEAIGAERWAEIVTVVTGEETETEETEAETIEETAEEVKEVTTMKKYFKVTFEYAEGIYCTNLAHAETAEDVEREYSKYPWRSIKEAQPWDVEEAKMKGMPIIEVETAPAEDPEAVTLAPAEDAQVWDENGETVTPDTEEEEEEETMTTANELQKYVDSIAADLRKMYEADLTDEEREAAEENGEACDLYTYFADALDIEYTISSRGDFLGARIAVALGGPNIYVDTREGYVKGYWGTDRAEAWIPSEICEEINGIMEEYYDMVRGA